MKFSNPLLNLNPCQRWMSKTDWLLTSKNVFYINGFFVFQELKAGVVSGQLLLDFLCQSGPQVLGADVQTHWSERTIFAETLGALRLQWMDFERELESQVCFSAANIHTVQHYCLSNLNYIYSAVLLCIFWFNIHRFVSILPRLQRSS